jgi:hypothetical protein
MEQTKPNLDSLLKEYFLNVSKMEAKKNELEKLNAQRIELKQVPSTTQADIYLNWIDEQETLAYKLEKLEREQTSVIDQIKNIILKLPVKEVLYKTGGFNNNNRLISLKPKASPESKNPNDFDLEIEG